MDYFDLLKRAWNITWRYKALWVLGLFAGAMSGSGGSSGGSNLSGGEEEFSASSLDQAISWAAENVVLIAIVVGGLFIISTVLWILAVAAQGGIAHGTNEAAEGRTPALRDSWSVGFAKWGRTFMVQFVLGLPLLVVVMVMAGLFAVFGLSVASGSDAAGGVGIGLCFFFPLLLAVIVAASVIIGILLPVAVRYGVLLDVTYGQAIKRAWDDLWGKKGLVVFWLVMLLPGIAYGFAVFAVALVALVPAGVAVFAEQYYIAGAFVVLMVLMMMLPNAIYATFVHAAWTLMFRHLTGLEQPSAPALDAPPPGSDV
ncbi:MAG: hypothetical protein JW733_05890 [Coriobacteriia bacterium]|nr:hypothetical protein [Coriobacteriia bacterium]